ncbi:hypothetical protein [Vibrio campbellii]|uniref:hypothetical protein n=1 Tax=Vibrio campbellii TaxID=680 RepID=UPI0037DDC1B4
MKDIGFHTNCFIVFDFVPENELQTGRRLEEAINDSLIQTNSEMMCFRHRCPNKQSFLRELDNLSYLVEKKGIFPYVHIEGHGSPEKLELLDGSTVLWSEVFEKFRAINILSKNNLFFSSGACNSAYSMASVTSICKASPVYGLLAPEKIVQAGSVQDGFVAFYQSLILTGSLNSAFSVFTDKANGKDYALIFSDLLFEKVAFKYLTEQCMGKGRKKRLENVLTEAMKKVDMPLHKARKELKKQLQGPQALALKRFYEKFMIIDIHPENGNRFKFDFVKFERDVKQGKIKIT